MNDYIKKKTISCNIKLAGLIEKLPSFCKEFFTGIEQTTTVLTRINYAYDLCVFFYYLINETDKFKDKSLYELNVSDIENISVEDIENFLKYLSYFKYYDKICVNNEKAKARKLSAVKRMFHYFFQKDKIKSDISEKVKGPKLHEKEIIRLETDEVVKLLNIAEYGDNLSKSQMRYHNVLKARDLAILTLFLGTGIRISECVGLNVEDINFENNSFKITRKGGNEAILYFSDEVSSALLKYINERNQKCKKMNIKENALFLSLQNKRISMRAVENLVKKYSRIITPLKTISPHKLRSTYGTALYRETKDIYVVADVLGHKDVNTTKKHYAALSDDIRRQAAGKVKLRDKD
jgi:site-specific recombinase XerD